MVTSEQEAALRTAIAVKMGNIVISRPADLSCLRPRGNGAVALLHRRSPGKPLAIARWLTVYQALRANYHARLAEQ